MPLLQDNTAWIALTSALGAAALALALAVSYVVLRGRSSRLEQRLSELARELARARDEARRTRQLSALASMIELDAILPRALEAATALARVDSAMIVIPQDEDVPVVATRGMTPAEAARRPFAGEGIARDAHPIEISYRYAPDEVESGGDVIRGGLVVPLRSDAGEAIGTLAVFWREPERKPADEEVCALEELARNAGPAIENARRFREARKLADLDALTSLHNRRYFHETLAREVARARRYDRRLALVVFDVDDFKAINERVGHLAGDSVLAQLGERVRSVVRSADVACRVGGDEFAVILPEATLADAEQLYRRLHAAVSTRPTGPADRLHLSAGIAELTPEDDHVSFFERADEALFRAKDTGKGQAVTAERSR